MFEMAVLVFMGKMQISSTIQAAVSAELTLVFLVFSTAMEVTWQTTFIVSLQHNKGLKAQSAYWEVFAKAKKKRKRKENIHTLSFCCMSALVNMYWWGSVAFKRLSEAFL